MKCKNCGREIRPATDQDYFGGFDFPNPGYRHVEIPRVSCGEYETYVELDEADVVTKILERYEV